MTITLIIENDGKRLDSTLDVPCTIVRALYILTYFIFPLTS